MSHVGNENDKDICFGGVWTLLDVILIGICLGAPDGARTHLDLIDNQVNSPEFDESIISY